MNWFSKLIKRNTPRNLSEELRNAEMNIKSLEASLYLRDKQIQDLQLTNSKMRVELLGKDGRVQKAVALMNAATGDIEPIDTDQRKDFVAQVSNAFDVFLEKKLTQLIAVIREELDRVHDVSLPAGMDRTRYDDFLRGSSNACKLLLDWGELLKGEHRQNISINNE